MQVAEVHIFGLSDPVLALLSVAGLVGFAVFVAAAVPRLRGRAAAPRQRGLGPPLLAGGILFAVAFVGTLLYTWVASRVLR